MKQWMVMGLVALGVSGLVSVSGVVDAAEHGGATTAPAGKEHGGTTTTPAATPAAKKEHGGATHEHGGTAVQAEPSAEQIRQTIQQHVQGIAKQHGTFSINDPVTGAARQLELVRVHDRVGKTGSLYYSCTDMRDTKTSEALDLDFDVSATGGNLKVVGQRIHKVNGQPRYTYDEHDNRIPVSSTSNS